MAPRSVRDVVILVPGFLGFARLGGFYYFADRVIAVLRGQLEGKLQRAVPVIPCRIPPTSPLAERQECLASYLRKLCTDVFAVERIHLVGHSTGGVDAQLLLCERGLSGPWQRDDDRVFRRKIASVVTLASPHHGTRLAESSLAKAAEDPLRHPSALIEQIRLMLHLVKLLPREVAATAGLDVAAPNDVLKFAAQILGNRQLVTDLRPDHMERLRADARPDRPVPVTCFVTGTRPRNAGRPSDPFFRDLYELTAIGDGTPPSPAMEKAARSLQRWMAKPEGILVSGDGEVPADVDTDLNDGIVNSAAQLLDPDDEARFGGFVVADHGDVLGHYDRCDSAIEGKPLNAGLFHSGAGFDDDAFFTLYRRIASVLLRSIQD